MHQNRRSGGIEEKKAENMNGWKESGIGNIAIKET